MSCLIPSNPDIAGIGVRIAIYVQTFLCFIPAIWALWDSYITDYELESLETQSTTNLILAFAILISCSVQALTSILSNYHAYIVLSMSWMNNTNAFIYFLLYVHYKANLKDGPGHSPVKPEWSAWKTHLKSQLQGFLHISDALLNKWPRLGNGGAGRLADEDGGKHNSSLGHEAKKSSAKILFGRIALFMGSLHLTVMAALGIWLWSNPHSFGRLNSNCSTGSVVLTIIGADVPFTSSALRVFSLALYAIFLLPGFNLVIPMVLFLGFFIWHHKHRQELAPPTRVPTDSAPFYLRIIRSIREVAAKSMRSSIFPICIGLLFLLAINIVFVIDIELTLRKNEYLQASGEAEWGFGQVLAVLLLFMPLRDLVEMMLARRQRRQEMQIRNHELKEAIVVGNADDIVAMVKAGADASVKAGDNRSALEVVSLAEHWEGILILSDSGSDINTVFADGRTALHVAVSHKQWELVPKLVNKGTDLTSKPPDSRTALEVAFQTGQWAIIPTLLDLNANVSKVTWPGSSSLETWACSPQRPPAVRSLLMKDADVGSPFPEDQTLLEVLAKAKDWEGVRDLVLSNFDVDSTFTDGRTLLGEVVLAKEWDLVQEAIEAGADVNKQFRRKDTTERALRVACQLDAPIAVLELMLEKGADPNVKDGKYDRPCLHEACRDGRDDAVVLLLKHGANPNLIGSAGFYTSLHHACRGGHTKCAQILLEAGAEINKQERYKETPLHLATSYGNVDCVKLLLENGADVSIMSASTFLVLVIPQGNQSIFALKLQTITGTPRSKSGTHSGTV
ncbi:hypothetical protein NMY22_g13736 [Coprinellus aureogranulatus]|nr:hypothetical protein NMY22_g13736 [Coprinellus aureogranulatus]